MKKPIRNYLVGSALALVASAAFGHDRDDLSPAAATELYYNAQVYTPEGWAEAMAVADGVILAVGTNEEMAQQADAATRRMDMQGRTLLPGLHDAHVHVLFAGMEQFACGFEPGASPERISQRVGECVADALTESE